MSQNSAYASTVHSKAIDLVKLAVDMTAASGSGHPTSAASLAHFVTVLMYDHMRYDRAAPDDPAADRMVLSEGHACPIVYAAGADLGIAIGKQPQTRRPMTVDDAMTLRELDSVIDGHPNPAEGFPFFPAATGSLGQGLSVAAGLALAARLDNLKSRMFCLIGDGESREGQIWEAADFVIEQDLRAVCPIFNCNQYGQSDKVSMQQSAERTTAKLEGSGFEVHVIDGHDPLAIRGALDEHAARMDEPGEAPVAIVAKTVKGWGAATMQGGGLHGKAMTGDTREAIMAELDATAREIGATWHDRQLVLPSPQAPSVTGLPAAGSIPSFSETLRRTGREEILQEGKLATRKAYGLALQQLGHADARVVALDGDVKNSTYSEYFYKDAALTDRFFECRIAEQHMISCAAGLAAGGRLPFVSSFGKFLVRGYDQLEMAILSRVNFNVVGSHSGISLAADGPSQMAVADVAFLRAYTTVFENGRPLLILLNPADAYAAYALTRRMASYDGVCYMRTHRPNVPFVYDDSTEFRLDGHHVLAQGQDLLIVTSGYMVHDVLKTLPELEKSGVNPTVADFYSLPLDPDGLAALAGQNRSRVLTVEDNYGAGLGGAVAEALTERAVPCRVHQLTVRRPPKSARTPDEIMAYTGVGAKDIVTAAQELAGT